MVKIATRGSYAQVRTGFAHKEQCKRILGGRWVKKDACWEYPIEALPFILDAFPDAEMSSGLKELADKLIESQQITKQLISREREPRKHAFLLAHQRLCRDVASYMNKWAFYCDTGTGKTILAYGIAKDKLEQGHKALVLSPRSIIKTAWMADHEQFFPELRVLPLSTAYKSAVYRELGEKWGLPPREIRCNKDTLIMKLAEVADVIVTNPEMFKNREWVREWDFDTLIVDESSILRNMKTEITDTVIRAADRTLYVYLLSGKPAPNSELEYFPQMRVVNPSLFGTSFYKFRDLFFEQTDYFGHNFRLKPDRVKEFTDRLSMGCVFISKSDCLDLPPELPPVRRMIELSPKAKKYYLGMERDKLLQLDNKDIAVNTKLAAIMKLRQITSGFIIDTEEETSEMLHTAKLDELRDVVTELGDNNAIIWINFKPEVKAISNLLESMGKTYVTAYSGTKNLDESIEAFKRNEAQFIIAHPKTLRYGVTFTGSSMKRNCTYAIYFSMSYSYEDFYQSHDRIYRKGQTESCTYIYLIVDGTIDDAIYDAIVKKGDAALIVENLVKQGGKK